MKIKNLIDLSSLWSQCAMRRWLLTCLSFFGRPFKTRPKAFTYEKMHLSTFEGFEQRVKLLQGGLSKNYFLQKANTSTVKNLMRLLNRERPLAITAAVFIKKQLPTVWLCNDHCVS